MLPCKEQFPHGPACRQTALQELADWHGYPDRLNRASLMKGIEEGFASPHSSFRRYFRSPAVAAFQCSTASRGSIACAQCATHLPLSAQPGLGSSAVGEAMFDLPASCPTGYRSYRNYALNTKLAR